MDGAASGSADRAGDAAVRRPASRSGDLEGARVGPRRDRATCPASPTPGRAGRTPPCRPSSSATTCATCARCSTATATAARFYGHFGQGCVHTRIDFDLRHARRASRKYRAFIDEAADLVVSLRRLALGRARRRPGARASCCRRCSARSWSQAFREFKAIWDPDGKMNPGKVVDPYRIDANLRLGADYHPPQPRDALRTSPTTSGSFAARHAALRRRRQVPHAPTAARCARATWSRARRSTRRAAARGCCSRCCEGDALDDGWRDETVKEALDLCLACKGCKGDCPVNVDMATYKAEFLSHYYAGPAAPAHRLRVRADPLVGAAGRARAGAREPAHARRRRSARRWPSGASGIAPQRRLPALRAADVHATGSAGARRARPAAARGPALARHVQQLLPSRDRAGRGRGARGRRLRGRRARRRRCAAAGRSTTTACSTTRRRLLRQILDALRPQIARRRAGRRPRAELRRRVPRRAAQPVPDDEDAQRLARQTFLLSEFLRARARTTSRRASAAEGARARPLPPQGAHGHGRESASC